jgi:hypothetical protein
MLTIDLEKQLLKQNSNVTKEEEILMKNVQDILTNATSADNEVLNLFGNVDNIRKMNTINAVKNKVSHLEQGRIFTTDQIKAIAIKYRLRFLSTKLYKGELPYEAISKIREFKKENPTLVSKSEEYSMWRITTNTGMRILAPAESFDLQERPKDPLLFVELGNDKWFLLHKWGNDLSITRWLTSLPLRNWFTLALTSGLILGGIIKFCFFIAHPAMIIPGVISAIALIIVNVYNILEEGLTSSNLWSSPFKD